MWNKISEEAPPYYKKIQVWVDNDERKASFNQENEFLYWDGEPEPLEYPSHWRSISPPENNIKRVCF